MDMKADIPGVRPELPPPPPWQHPNTVQMGYLNTWLRFLSTRKIPYNVWRRAGKKRDADEMAARREALGLLMQDSQLERMMKVWVAKRKAALAKPAAAKNHNIARRLMAAHIREVMWDAASDAMLAMLVHPQAGLVMVLPLDHVELLADEGNKSALLCRRIRRVDMP